MLSTETTTSSSEDMVLQHLVSLLQNAQSVNIHSMTVSKTEQTAPLNCQSDSLKSQARRPLWTLTLLGTLCCISLLSSVVLAVLYGRQVKSNLNPELARGFPDCRKITALVHSLSPEHSALQRSVWNLTELNQRLEVRCDELAGNNSQLTFINRTLSLETARHEEMMLNLTEANRHLKQENNRLVILNAVFAEERLGLSATIGTLEKQNENLTNLYQRELKRSQELSALNDNLSQELRQTRENSTFLWMQSQELLDQNVLLQSENLQMREMVGRVSSEIKECERIVRNLTEAQENQNLGREILELSNRVQLLQEEFTSLNLYCPVVNQTTQERCCRTCEDGWSLFRSRCYFFSRDSNSWTHGRTQCQSQGADLLVISSKEEQRFIFDASWQSSPKERAWIGMTDMETEGEWRWVDSSLVRDSVQYWLQRADGSSEPDDWRMSDERGEDCGHIDTAETELNSWMDAPCHTHYRWICEKAL